MKFRDMMDQLALVTKDVRFMARAVVYAALYVALTVSPGLNALSYGSLQFRVSEGLLPFAFVDPAAVVGIALGTLIANIVGSPFGPIDWVFGTLWTVIAVLVLFRVGPRLWALLVPVALNGIGVGWEIAFVDRLGFHGFLVAAASVGAGEACVMATIAVAVWALAARFWSVLGLPPEAGRRLAESPLVGRLGARYLDAGRPA